MNLNLSFGADPEVFSVAEDLGIISPALLETAGIINPLVDDSKHPVFIKEREFLWMMDGAAWEVTILQPHKNPKDLFKVIKNALEALDEYIYPLSYLDRKLEIKKLPAFSIEKSLYNLKNPKIFQGFISGCDPDEDALDNEYKCKTQNYMEFPYRFGGGHIHVSSFEVPFEKNPKAAIFCQILTTGLFALVNSPYPKEDLLRLQTYGKPGRFRFQKGYKDGSKGVEYRSPSNAWISLPEDKVEELFWWVRKGVEIFKNERVGINLCKLFLNDAGKAIGNGDIVTANQLLNNIKEELK